MPPWIFTLVGAGISLVTFIGTIIVQSRAAARIEGALGAKVENHAEKLSELGHEQDQQWTKINNHGERISGLEAKTAKL